MFCPLLWWSIPGIPFLGDVSRMSTRLFAQQTLLMWPLGIRISISPPTPTQNSFLKTDKATPQQNEEFCVFDHTFGLLCGLSNQCGLATGLSGFAHMTYRIWLFLFLCSLLGLTEKLQEEVQAHRPKHCEIVRGGRGLFWGCLINDGKKIGIQTCVCWLCALQEPTCGTPRQLMNLCDRLQLPSESKWLLAGKIIFELFSGALQENPVRAPGAIT